MLRIPWSTDIGLAYSQICVTLISLIAWSRSPTISAAKRLGGQRSQGISLPSWKLSHLFYIGALAFISSETHGPVRSLMVGAGGTNARGRVRSSVPVHVIPLATILNFPHKLTLSLFLFLSLRQRARLRPGNVGDVFFFFFDGFTDYSPRNIWNARQTTGLHIRTFSWSTKSLCN